MNIFKDDIDKKDKSKKMEFQSLDLLGYDSNELSNIIGI